MPKRQLVALWFADIAGYSKRASEDEGRALELVDILQEEARRAIRHHDGRIVKFLGDAVLAEFPSTELAVRAGVSLSRSYPVRSAVTGQAHELRIGVHVGDVAVGADGDIYGDGVNAAARVQEAAQPGQVVVSEDVQRQLRGRSGFRFESLGEHSLKGVGAIGLHRVIIDLAGSLVGSNDSATPAREKPRKIRSIAVLPFADLSPERDQEYFSDGVAEEILDGLAKVEDLRVPARTSCFAFRGASIDIREIGTRLGVEAVLEGSVRKAGARLRITAQLIDARDGYHLWSERFDREMENIFAIQDEIALRILDALGFSQPRSSVVRISTANVGAYDFYLRGRKFFQKWTRQNVQFARRMFARAIEIDPTFAAAWAGLATAHVHLFRWGRETTDLEEARAACRRALELDPNLAEAHVAAGQVLTNEHRHEEAAIEFQRAIELDADLFDAYYYYARSSFENGEFEKAIRLYDLAHRKRPEDYQSLILMCLPLRQSGRLDEAREVERRAIEVVVRSLELDPGDARAYSLGSGCLANVGDIERARQWTEQAVALAPDDPVILYNHACTLANLGDDEAALDGLERAIEARVSHWAWITRDTDWARLRDHPRFRALVERITPSS